MSLEISYADIQAYFDGEVIRRTPEFISLAISRALVTLKGKCPNVAYALNHQDEADPDYLFLVKSVIVDAVVRLVNDDRSGFLSEKESSYEYTRDRLAASSNIWFPEADLEALGCGKHANYAYGSFTAGVGTRMVAPHPNTWCGGF